MFTRTQYLHDKCTHREYYGQYVTDEIIKIVENKFGIGFLTNEYSKDQHFNTIPLITWDTLNYWIGKAADKELMKANGDYMTLSGSVCIAKEAARIIVEK